MEKNVFYANGLAIAISKNDCCLTFKTLIPDLENEENTSAVISNSEYILMSIPYAKELAKSLTQKVEKYESIYGPIHDLISNKENEAEEPDIDGEF